MKNKILLFAALLAHRLGKLFNTPRDAGGIQFANSGEGTHEHGLKTYIPDAATTSRYLLYEAGSDADHCVIGSGTNEPLGVSDDMADAAALDEGISIKLLGAIKGTTRMISDGTVTNGCRVALLKDGTGRVFLGANGTFWLVGKAIVPTDANIAAGDPVEVIPCFPVSTAF